ncbi:MAG TPA: peptidoglycan-binding domain-containing protein [Candidatus Omnitrophota bacterium]|nr:peptidoglycan-binding domain-containing protein [Candidatus Omnitrophota bacterium]
MKDGAKIFGCLLICVLLMPGCATKKMKQEVNLLKTQVGGLTTELNRVSEEMRVMQENSKSDESNRRRLEQEVASLQGGVSAKAKSVTVTSGVYRTPSGFELQAISIQRALKNAGYYDGSIDGKVGSGTTDAIRRFQSDNGLKADGICGRKTWAKLKMYEDSAVK